MQKTTAQLNIDLDNWKVSVLDPAIDNAAPVIFPSIHNNVLTEFYNISKDIADSYYNKQVGLAITDVTGLTTALNGKEPADATILKEADVVDNLTTNSATAPLSAEQGFQLKALIDGIHSPENDTMLAQGTTNEVTANDLRNHLDDDSIHFPITDGSTSLTSVWSSQKVSAELSGKAAAAHTHAQLHNQNSDTHLDIGNPNEVSAGALRLHLDSTANPHGTTLQQVISASGLSLSKGTMLVSDGSVYTAIAPGTDGEVLKVNSATSTGLEWSADQGEINGGVNVGTGRAVFKGVSGTDLQFRRLESANSILTITENTDNVSFSVVASEISHNDLADNGSLSHAAIDAHIGTITGNPHGVTKSDIGLSNVPNVDATDVDTHVSGTTNKVFTAAEQTKLSGIATSATANPTQSGIADLATTVSGSYVQAELQNVYDKVDSILLALRNSNIIS